MRVVTFNILNARPPGADRVDLDAFATAIAGLDPDVLALQEVDRHQPRSEDADLTAIAAEAMGAAEHRFVPALAGTPGSSWVTATGDEPPEGPAYGIALLSRLPVAAWQVVRLPAPVGPSPDDEPRVAVAAEVHDGERRLTVANTHLSFDPGWNDRQLRALVSALAGAVRPLVLVGDLNMPREQAVRVSGLRSTCAVPTFPAADPQDQLDHVLVEGPLRPRHAESRLLPVSDHRALVVDLV